MAVKDVWNDDDNFVVELAGSNWGVFFKFPIRELAEGASLSRMMNLKVKKTLEHYQGMVPKDELKAVAKEGLAALRGIIEPYFATKGLA